MEVLHARCAALDVHKKTIVACARYVEGAEVHRRVRTFGTTTKELLALSAWLAEHGCTHVAMEATGRASAQARCAAVGGTCSLLSSIS